MAAPHPAGHPRAMVDDVPHPATRRGRPPVSGRTRLAVRVHPGVRTDRLERDGSTLPAAGPRAASRWAGKCSRDPRRDAVGRRRTVAGGDRLGCGCTPTSWPGSTARTRSLHRPSGQISAEAAIAVGARRDRDWRAGGGTSRRNRGASRRAAGWRAAHPADDGLSATVVIERRTCPCCRGERPDPG